MHHNSVAHQAPPQERRRDVCAAPVAASAKHSPNAVPNNSQFRMYNFTPHHTRSPRGPHAPRSLSMYPAPILTPSHPLSPNLRCSLGQHHQTQNSPKILLLHNNHDFGADGQADNLCFGIQPCRAVFERCSDLSIVCADV